MTVTWYLTIRGRGESSRIVFTMLGVFILMTIVMAVGLFLAKARGVPAVVSTGCLDMVNFGSPETVPAKFAGRKFYQHNPQVTLMRTSPEECAQLGRLLAEKLNLSCGPVTVLLPLRGGSVIGAPGGPFHDPAADGALYASLKGALRSDIPVVELDCAINDPAFAEACAQALLQQLGNPDPRH